MIEAGKTWLFGVIATAMILSVLYTLLPKGAFQTIAKVTGGLTMLLVVVRPLLVADIEEFDWKYDDYQTQIDQQIEVYREANQKQMETIIQQETGAYISEKAEQMGLTCRVQVETQLLDGVPQPVAVTLDVDKHAELSRWIAEELGIGPEQQRWG